MRYLRASAYTNRFFSLCSAQNKSENANKTGTRQLGNQVIRKGHMVIQNLGIMKGMFVYRSALQISHPFVTTTRSTNSRRTLHSIDTL